MGVSPKSHCKHGHDLSSVGVQQYKGVNKNGRRCMTCANDRHIKRRYGLNSIKERNKLLESQGNKCAICETTDARWGQQTGGLIWAVDHKHDGTCNYRSILCSRCNLALGLLHEDVELMYKFIDYVRQGQDV